MRFNFDANLFLVNEKKAFYGGSGLDMEMICPDSPSRKDLMLGDKGRDGL